MTGFLQLLCVRSRREAKFKAKLLEQRKPEQQRPRVVALKRMIASTDSLEGRQKRKMKERSEDYH